MEKEKMLDGSNRTFWHTRFKPTVAKPPHYVILQNPVGKEIEGLSYATWSGGNGNGQVKAYSIHLSDDGKNWESGQEHKKLRTKTKIHTYTDGKSFPSATQVRVHPLHRAVHL